LSFINLQAVFDSSRNFHSIDNKFCFPDINQEKETQSGFGGIEDACWPVVPKFEVSNQAEAVGFFRAKKSPARLPSKRR
jgi:hypothetical protein